MFRGVAGRSRHWRWRFAFIVTMLGTAALMILAGMPQLWPLLLVWPVLFGIPMWHEGQLDRKAEGEPSTALAKYDLRTLLAVLVYLACMFAAVPLGRAVGAGSPWLWPVALLPAVPILAVIWAMARYLAEETDEFLRRRAIHASLIGSAAVLVLATVWGMLELFKLVPHAGGWLAVPVFAVVRDVAKTWLKAIGR